MEPLFDSFSAMSPVFTMMSGTEWVLRKYFFEFRCDKYYIKVIHLVARILWSMVWLLVHRWGYWGSKEFARLAQSQRASNRFWTCFSIILKNALVGIHFADPWSALQLFSSPWLIHQSLVSFVFVTQLGQVQISLGIRQQHFWTPLGFESHKSYTMTNSPNWSSCGCPPTLSDFSSLSTNFRRCNLSYTLVSAQ